MSDQVQQCFNLNRDSMELGTFGYDMDGNANMASVLQVKKYYFYTYTLDAKSTSSYTFDI